MHQLRRVALALLLIGGLNWGLIGLFDIDLVALLLGLDSSLSRLAYIALGLAAAVHLISPERWDALSRRDPRGDAHRGPELEPKA